MRDQTFFTIVIGCFVAGMAPAFSFMVTRGVDHKQRGSVAFSLG
jgi:hypothetical protein